MGGQYLFEKNSMEKEKQICIIYIFYVCFGITKKTLPAFYEETELLILKEELLCVISFFLMFFYYYLVFIIYLSAVLYRFPHVDVNSFHIKSTWNVTGNLTTCIASNGSQSLVVDTVGLKPGTFQFGTNA